MKWLDQHGEFYVDIPCDKNLGCCLMTCALYNSCATNNFSSSYVKISEYDALVEVDNFSSDLGKLLDEAVNHGLFQAKDREIFECMNTGWSSLLDDNWRKYIRETRNAGWWRQVPVGYLYQSQLTLGKCFSLFLSVVLLLSIHLLLLTKFAKPEPKSTNTRWALLTSIIFIHRSNKLQL